MDQGSVRNLIKKVKRLQEERVATYKLFDDGHKAYMQAAPKYNFAMYRQLVHEITETFKRISEDILKIKDELQSTYDLSVIAKIIEAIQAKEQKKLEMTAKLQITVQNVQDHPEDSSYREDVQDLKQSLQETKEEINDLLEELKYESEEILTS